MIDLSTEILEYLKDRYRLGLPDLEGFVLTDGIKLKIKETRMRYKGPYKVPRRLEELMDTELETVWWRALRRDEFGTIYCDPKALKEDLIKLLNDHT